MLYSKEETSQRGQSPLGHWEPASSATMTANQGSTCLPEAHPRLNRGWELQNDFYEITKKLTNQSQRELTQVLSTWFLHFLVSENLCTIKNNWVPKKLLFICITSINILCIRN